MVRICERPECFKHLEDGFMYFEGYDDKPYVYAAILPVPPAGYLHLEVERLTHNTLKKLIVDWDILKRILKNNGIKLVVITKEGNLEENKSYVKFLKFLGLSQPSQILIGNYEI